jgi:micrococcal nuclease
VGRSLIFCLVLIVEQVWAAAPVNSCEHDSRTFRCVQYIKNYDADTITVKIPGVHPLIGEKISVRVAGVDAAEMKSKTSCEYQSARDARKLVESQLKRAKNIELRNVQRDKYFRILADVAVDGVLIKDLLVKNKLAVAYDGGAKSKVDWCTLGSGARLPAQK